MKPFRFVSPAKQLRNWSRIALGAVMILLGPGLSLADDPPAETEARPEAGPEQIQIVADKLTTHTEEKYAEFVGNVMTTHPDFEMVSENLRIYYQGDLPDLKHRPGNPEFIKRLVASGNVLITSDEYTARTQSAEYVMETMILVLDGENSTVQSGKNILTGSKITIYRKDGKIEVEGGPQNRVKAVFHSN